jgi:hypothetical protein
MIIKHANNQRENSQREFKHRSTFFFPTTITTETVMADFWVDKEDTVSEECEHDEVDGGEHSAPHAPLGLNPMIHHCIPVLAGEDLQG